MDALDEETQLALALSLSEASARSGPPAAPTPPPNAAAQRPAPGAAEDEAVARRLQEQYDREAQASLPPCGSNGAQRGPPLTPPPMPPPLPPQLAGVAANPNCCAGCGQALRQPGLGLFGLAPAQYITALGRAWHPLCFKCAACGQPLAGGGSFTFGGDQGLPYHPACHKEPFHPRCAVCADHVPCEGGARITWSVTPFWGDKACPVHIGDGTKRCTSCTRLQPRREEWAELEDGRTLCLLCLTTVVPDTAACQPLYDDVLAFYAHKGMPLPARPPLMLVDDAALNAAESGETSGRGRGGGPIFHTRGLCLTEYSTSVRTVVRGVGGLVPLASGRREVQLGPTRCEVTAILVLYGLPRLLTGSILAHEAMHAWLRLGGYRGLDPQVEEGLCQLMALLWLEAQQPRAAGAGGVARDAAAVAYEERLAAFLGHQIRTDRSAVYGDGLRAAHEAFQRFGLQTVLAHVRRSGLLPT